MTGQRLTSRVRRGLAWIVSDVEAHFALDLDDLSPAERRDLEDAVEWISKFADASAKHGRKSLTLPGNTLCSTQEQPRRAP